MIQTFAIMTFAVLGTATGPEGALPRSLDLSVIRAIPVQHDGRCMPLDRVARDLVEAVTGRGSFHDRDPVLWLLARTFDPQSWMARALIGIGNAELRGELRLPESQTVFSFSELAGHQHLHGLIDGLSHIPQLRFRDRRGGALHVCDRGSRSGAGRGVRYHICPPQRVASPAARPPARGGDRMTVRAGVVPDAVV